MNDVQQRNAAKHFADFWKGKGYEKGETQKFWLSLLGEVLGVEHPAEYITFEDQVHLDHTSFMDGYIPLTRVLIEQKGLGKDLRKPIRQSDGSLLTPFQQAKRYITELPVDAHPKWVITCNFERFLIYDMNRPNGEPEEIQLKDLPTEYYRLNFLVDTGDENIKREMEISIQAGELVGKLYDAFLKQYKDASNERTLKSLNALCVRLVFACTRRTRAFSAGMACSTIICATAACRTGAGRCATFSAFWTRGPRSAIHILRMTTRNLQPSPM